MPDHGQKKRDKQKRKRSKAGRPGVSYAAPTAVRAAERRLAAQLPSMPEGPCFITRGWQVPSQPRLQCIIATRQADEDTLIPAAILVDLGCQGVRDAYFVKPTPRDGMPALLDVFQQMFARKFEQVAPARAAAIVEQAVEHASEVGLEVPEKARHVLGVLPEEAEADLEVEMGRRNKALYSPSPGEDMKPMIKRLVQAVGPDGFEVELPKSRNSEGGSDS